ncbi:zinc ribbon domain-containing protein [Myxococcus sp. AS-1-15]|uniref:zinc ribbon domain-containing protein n=1 Tax=Myxococcus sp. AS-1-15 TaxID=2874600 RepID=UPI001CBF4237|nr:zinc ribbon domain-containing protein [Myxococcus sp. AS-1-15]MBZ4401309.1 zinc ribbon domain-containing protein [Myxococcus sp. AS-1-15]
MFIIYGSSAKQQELGERPALCRDCQRETPHRLQRHYSVAHVFWFPLFSLRTKYVLACSRCNLHSEVPEQSIGHVPTKPVLHRLGGLFPLGAMLFCCVGFPVVGAVTSAVTGTQDGTEVQEERHGFDQRFHAQAEDLALQEALQSAFEDAGHTSISVTAASAAVKDQGIRVITARSTHLKKVSNPDRVKLLELMQRTADQRFEKDEVFVGLQGKLLWGGYAHRLPGGAWQHVVKSTTTSPKAAAFEALLQLEAQQPSESPDALPTPVADDTAP